MLIKVYDDILLVVYWYNNKDNKTMRSANEELLMRTLVEEELLCHFKIETIMKHNVNMSSGNVINL